MPFQIYFKFFLFNHILSNEVWEHRDFAKENIKYPFHIKGPYYFKHNGLNCHFLHFTICGTKKIWCFCNKKMVAFFNKRIFHGFYYSIKFYANCHHNVLPKKWKRIRERRDIMDQVIWFSYSCHQVQNLDVKQTNIKPDDLAHYPR